MRPEPGEEDMLYVMVWLFWSDTDTWNTELDNPLFSDTGTLAANGRLLISTGSLISAINRHNKQIKRAIYVTT